MLFIRVKDPSTGHEFDLPEDHPLITNGEVTPVRDAKRWPPSHVLRPPKHNIPRKTSAAAGEDQAPAEKE